MNTGEFKLEKEMTQPAADYLRSQGLFVKKEFQTPWGYCDLAGCSFDEDRVKARLSLGQRTPMGPQLRIAVLLAMPGNKKNEGVSLDELVRQFGRFHDADQIKGNVDRLLKYKFAIRDAAGTFKRATDWMPLQKRLVAVELKLTRIAEVLSQAVGNKGFAEESFVGLPMQRAKRVADGKKRDEFLRCGVGLLGVSVDDVQVLIEAGKEAPVPGYSTIQSHCVERFWRTFRPQSLTPKSCVTKERP